ncbi:MAG: iron chaperone [Flavobacteriales bacterium]
MKTTVARNVDEYIAGFTEDTRVLLEQLRATIQKAAPKAEEVISYQMPAYKLNGMLVYFAGYKNHIGFYPTASGTRVFKKEIAGYKNSKGTVQFPLNKPLPRALITKMVKFRVKENAEKAAIKAKAKK